MNQPDRVESIVFDVGRVLIDFSYTAFFGWLLSQGAQVDGVEDFVQKTDLHAYEKGQIDDEVFLSNLNRLLRQPLDRHSLVTRWVDLFAPIDDMLQLARQLKQHYSVYLLSNTSALHWRHIVPHYRLAQYCHGMLASFEVGVMKPEAGIFRAAEQRFGLQAKHSVFIDDIAENAAGAVECGWHGIQHKNSADTRAQLRRLGVIL